METNYYFKQIQRAHTLAYFWLLFVIAMILPVGAPAAKGAWIVGNWCGVWLGDPISYQG